MDQLARRAEVHAVRLLVYEFEPCEMPSRFSVLRPRRPDSTLARRIKHNLINALAPRVDVVEGDWGSEPDSRRPGTGEDPYSEARRLNANTALVGNFTMTGRNEILVMARLVDLDTNTVLATAEDTVREADIPYLAGYD